MSTISVNHILNRVSPHPKKLAGAALGSTPSYLAFQELASALSSLHAILVLPIRNSNS